MTKNVVRLATSRAEPVKKACLTCRYRRAQRFGLDDCLATGRSIFNERMDSDGVCGADGDMWEPFPPRRGLFGWIKVLLVGE